MKVLIALYSLNNLGGIILNQEGLVAGMKALGHEVETKLLVWKDSIHTSRTARRLTPERGAMGIPFDQELGWQWPAHMRFAYKGKHNLNRWKDYASRFDLIIWQIPVPTLQRSNRGNTDWLELYDVPAKQIIYTHDGNLVDAYPWVYAVMSHLTGAVGVHPCAYHAAANLPLPRALAFSPQQDIEARVAAADAAPADARKGWFSLQTFKGWKHVPDLIRAVPHMKNEEPKVLAGGGLHYYYLTSEDKVKEEYLASEKYDPDMLPEWAGQRIWNLAISGGMDYRGYLTSSQRDEELVKARFLIDPSWSKKYAGIGDHFNRTSIDGIISGCVPIARNYGVATNPEGEGEFFKTDVNYLMIPWDASPRVFAAMIDEFIGITEAERAEILARGRELLPLFDYRRTAQAFIDLAEGRPAGVYEKIEIGSTNAEMVKASEEAVNTFFAGQEETAEKEENDEAA